MSEQEQQAASEGGIGQSASTAELGAAVIVRGKVVAWFADWTEAAQEWCTENHFGEWLVWWAKPPEIVPLTIEEIAKIELEANDLYAKLNIEPEVPNAGVTGA